MSRHTFATLTALALALPGLGFAQDVENDPPAEPVPDPAPAQQDPAPAPQAPQAPQAPEQDPAPQGPTKASIAVIPFTYTAEVLARHRDGTLHTHIEQFETSTFTNKFVTALVNTRKFDVVERQRIDKLLDEMQMSESGIMDRARAVEAGRVVGADYVLTGEISVFNISTEWTPIPNTSRFSRKLTALIIVDMRIVDTRTSRVVAADKGEVRHEERSMQQARAAKPLEPDFVDKLQRELAHALTIHTIDGVYPIKIVSINGAEVNLNRGEGGGLEVGQVLDVYLPGDEIVDPDTGDSLGFEEVKIGQLQVTEILTRFAKAAIIETRNPLVEGAICRKTKSPEAAPQPTPRRGPRW